MERNWTDYLKIHSNLQGARAAFEVDCEALLQELHPGQTVRAVRANPGDEGIDVYVGKIGVASIDVYQCKFFLGPLGKTQKDQIRESFNRAVGSTKFKMKKWALCAPFGDFDLTENIWWDSWQSKQEQAYGIPIELINGAKLIRQFKQTGLYQQVFQIEDSLKLTALHEAVTGPGGVMENNLVASQQLAQALALLNAAAQTKTESADVDAVLNIAEQFIKQYYPRTALRLLSQLNQYLEEHHSTNDKLLARCEYLMSTAHDECGEVSLAYLPVRQAHFLQPLNRLYAAGAALAEAEQGNLDEAQVTARDLLETTPDQPVAHAVLVFSQGTPHLAAALDKVPATVTQRPEFKLALLDLLQQVDVSSATLLVGSDLQDFPCPDVLTFDTERYWIVVAKLIIQLKAGKAVYQDSSFIPLAQDEVPIVIRRAYEVLTLYIRRLVGTEKYLMAGHALFVQGLAGYYLTGNTSEFDAYQAIFFQQSATHYRHFGMFWANLLARWAKPEAVLTVLAVLNPETEPDIDYLRFFQLRALNQLPEAQNSLARYLERVTVIEEEFYNRAVQYLLLFCPTTQEREAFLDLCHSRGQLSQVLPAKLLRVIALQADSNHRPEMVQLLGECEVLVQQMPNQFYTLDIAELYCLVEEHEKSVLMLRHLPLVPEARVEMMAERLQIDNLQGLGKGSEELLRRLKDWRLTRPAEKKYCFWEFQMAETLGDESRMLEVGECAHAAFPDDPTCYWLYIYALHLLGLSERLCPEIERVAQQPDLLERPHLFNAAGVAKQAGWQRLALDMLYPFACEREDIQARDKFMQLSLFGGKSPVAPTQAAIGTTVTFTLDGKPHPPLALTSAAVEDGQHPFAKQLLGLRTGDTFTVFNTLRNRPRQGVVLTLLDPHTALFQDILRQAEEQDGDFSVQSLRFASHDFEELERVLVEQFGADEQARRDATKELLAECAVGEAGFSAVARSVCSGNGLDAYRLLTSSDSAGFFVTPFAWYDQIELSPELDYILDWSTLPLFYQLHQAQLLNLPKSLWVSAQLPESLRELIAQKERIPPPRMSLTISKRQVRGVSYPDTYQQEELTFLRQLLVWVTEHCQCRLVPEKLDVLREAARQQKDWHKDDDYDYFNGILDTIFIADHSNALLISDDMVLNELLRQKDDIVSSEKFLRTFAAEQFNGAILPVLLQKCYVGLAIDAEVLLAQLIESGGGFRGAALQYLESLPLLVRADPRESLRIHKFLLILYLNSTLSPAQKSAATILVYVYALRHLNPVPALRRAIRQHIYQTFHLLPIHQTQLLQDFDLAWQLLSKQQLLGGVNSRYYF